MIFRLLGCVGEMMAVSSANCGTIILTESNDIKSSLSLLNIVRRMFEARMKSNKDRGPLVADLFYNRMGYL
jgi:hypothetical protein